MASSDAFKAQQQKGTAMRTPLILAGATLLLSACGDKNEAAEEKLDRAAETSATVAGPVPAALGLSAAPLLDAEIVGRSAEHTSDLPPLIRTSYAVFCLQKKQKPSRIWTG